MGKLSPIVRVVRLALAAIAAIAAALIAVPAAVAADWTPTPFGTAAVSAPPATNARGDVVLAWAEVNLPASPLFVASRQPDGSYATQQVGVANTAQSLGAPRVAVDSLGNVTVVWSDDNGAYAARHAPGEPFGPPHQIASGPYVAAITTGGTAESLFAWSAPESLDGQGPTSVHVARWGPADTDPRVTTFDPGPQRYLVKLETNAEDDAMLLYDAYDPDRESERVAVSHHGGPFVVAPPPAPYPQQELQSAALLADGGVAAAWGDPPEAVGYLTPDGRWVAQGQADDFVHGIAVDASGQARGATYRVSADDSHIESIRWRPGEGGVVAGPTIENSGDTDALNGIARDARGGVTVLTQSPGEWSGTDPPPDFTERIVSLDASGARTEQVMPSDARATATFGTGPTPGEIFDTEPSRPGPFALWTRDLPPPPPPAPPPAVAVARPASLSLKGTSHFRVKVGCPQSCSIVVTGIGPSRHATAAPGKRTSLLLIPTHAQRMALRRALARHRRGRLRLRATATFPSGRQLTASRTITVKQPAKKRPRGRSSHR